MITQPNQDNNSQAGFRPFTPRLIELNYRVIPAGPKVFLQGSDAGSGVSDVLCGPDYPYDPRNLSLEEVFWNTPMQFSYNCPGLGVLQIVVPQYTFYSIISQADADQIACDAAAQKARYKGWSCATCQS